MAYRRKQVMTRSATFVDDYRSYRDRTDDSDSSTSSLAAQAIRASALHRDSSLSSAYADAAFTASSDRGINQNQVPLILTFFSKVLLVNVDYSSLFFWRNVKRAAMWMLCLGIDNQVNWGVETCLDVFLLDME